MAAIGAPQLDRGLEALRQGDPVTAERLLREAIRGDPRNPAIAKPLGMALASQEKYADAEPYFRLVCELTPRDPDGCYYLARTLFTRGRIDESVVYFRKALALPQRRARAWHGLALSLSRSADPKGADEAFRQALQLGQRAAAWDYAQFLLELNRPADALAILQIHGSAEERARFERLSPREPAASPPPPVAFEIQPLPHVTRNGATGRRYLPETMIAGLAAFDFDNDGWPDLFLPNGARLPSLDKSSPEFFARLLRNRGGKGFDDVTLTVGLTGRGLEMGAAAADFDGDGKTDLFVPGVRESRLYRNVGVRFEDVTRQAGLPEASPWAVAAVWLDFDRDGRLDLFVARYVQWDPASEPKCDNGGHSTYCHPRLYNGLPNALYRNLGGGRFEDVSVRSGIASHIGKAMAVTVTDVDGDGWSDLFIANDTAPNFLFRNRGDGTFEERGIAAGVALKDDGIAVSSMGGVFTDFGRDGHSDLVVPALSDETFPFFRGLGGGRFEDARLASGLAGLTRPLTGWNSAAADFNRDGFADFAVACGHVQDNAERYSARSSRQHVTIFLNRGNGTFARQQIGSPSFYRGLAVADFDRDGWPDLAVTRLNESSLVFFNRGGRPPANSRRQR